MKSLRTVDAVHTHTHTFNLENIKNESTISTLLSIYVRDG